MSWYLKIKIEDRAGGCFVHSLPPLLLQPVLREELSGGDLCPVVDPQHLDLGLHEGRPVTERHRVLDVSLYHSADFSLVFDCLHLQNGRVVQTVKMKAQFS